MKKLLRQLLPDPQQLTLQLDFFTPSTPDSRIDQPAPQVNPSSPLSGLAAFKALFAPSVPSVPGPPPAPGKRRIRLQDHALDYSLRRSKRRSIGFLIDDDGLHVTAPRWVTVVEIESAIREKERWVVNKITERRQRSARLQPPMQWRDGATLPYLGGDVTLRIVSQQTERICFDEVLGELTLSLPADATQQQIKDAVLGWLQRQARTLFAQRLPIYAEKLGVQYKSFALSNAMTQWGSCTHDGRIRLNWRLMHFALPQIDYVIAHELAHMREMDHSPRFWATVQSVFPEFEAARKALRERGPETLPIF